MQHKQIALLTLCGISGSGGFAMLAWNFWVAIGLFLTAVGLFGWGYWGKIRIWVFRLPEASIDAIEAQYYIAEQGKFTVELEVVISCPNPPKHIAWLQLLIGQKAHDFSEIKPAFKDEITTENISYRARYEVAYRDFLLGRARYQEEGDSVNGDDIVGQAIARTGGKDIYSQEFKIWSKKV